MIDWKKSVVYGLGVLRTSLQFALNRGGLARSTIFMRGDRPPGDDERVIAEDKETGP